MAGRGGIRVRVAMVSTSGLFSGSRCEKRRAERSGMAGLEVREYSAEQILSQASAYPPMAAGECQMSTALLSAAYPELRYVTGTRRRIYAVPGTEPKATENVHWWNELADGTIIDSAFQPGPNTARDLPHITVRYIASDISKTERENADQAVRKLRQIIKKRMRIASGSSEERRRQVVEELRDDLPRIRRDVDPATPIQPRILRGDAALATPSPVGPPEDSEIPAAFRKRG